MYPLWLITVECTDIPEVEGRLPDVSPIYRRDDDGTSYLDRIELYPYTSEKKVIWRRSKE